MLPTYFISHGGGPWPWLKDEMPGYETLEASLQRMPAELGAVPRALVVVSAHWETREFRVMTGATPPMIYDYGGFPEHTYHVRYPAPGSPEVARRVAELLRGAGFAVEEDAERGFDHGLYSPMVAAYPAADMPMLQLSIRRDMDPRAHLAAGRALAPLRREGILLVGSGLSYHNLRMFGPAARLPSQEFDRWLDDTLRTPDPAARTLRLEEWSRAPSARVAHPREDHLVPLFVALGAAETEPATRVYHEEDFMGGVTASSYRFG